jgi:diguanylate cyclase (GGDEF)-like protein
MLLHGKVYACPPINDSEFSACMAQHASFSNDKPVEANKILLSWNIESLDLSIENKINYYAQLASSFSDIGDYKKSYTSAIEGQKLAKENDVFNKHTIQIHSHIGYSIEMQGQIELAGQYYIEANKMALSLGHLPTIIESYLDIGAYYYLSNQLDKSLISINEAKDLSVKLPNNIDSWETKGLISSELGNVYTAMDLYDESLVYQYEANDYFSKLGKKDFVLVGYSNLASSYIALNDFENAEMMYLKLLNESSNKDFIRHKFEALSGLGNLHINKKDYIKAIDFINQAELLIDEEGQIDLRVNIFIDKAVALIELKYFSLAENSLDKAENILSGMDEYSSMYQSLSVMKTRALLLSKTDRSLSAYYLQSKYIEKFIKLKNNKSKKIIEDIRIKYETEQSEIKNDALQKENELSAIKLNQSEIDKYEQEVKMVIMSLFLLVFAGMLGYQFVLKRRLTIAATTDGLTSVMNRRFLTIMGEELTSRSYSQKKPLSVIMLDVDHFKSINDNFGHAVGDDVLKKVSDISQSAMRKGDCFGRWGGEEFVAVLPDSNSDASDKVAQRMKKALSDYDWSEFGISYKVTASIGVVSCVKISKEISFTLLVDKADEAMYRAKKTGRNRIVTIDFND